MTSTADRLTPRAPHAALALLSAVGLLGLLAVAASGTPAPWAMLWLTLPVAVAAALLVAWRFGAWGLVVPAVAAGFAVREPLAPWSAWTAVAGLTGVWMGMREEGGGPALGSRAWMLVPLLVLAALLPLSPRWPSLVQHVDRSARAVDGDMLTVARQNHMTAERVKMLESAVHEAQTLRTRGLPLVLPALLFVWAAMLVAAGRALAARVAAMLHWPPLGRRPLGEWRLPDPVLAVLITGLALALFAGTSWHPSATTLIVGAVIGFCVQGIAVVTSALFSRGVPPPLVVLSLSFLFAIATPVFVLVSAIVGLSDVWLDYRRLEPSSNEEA